MRICAGRPFNAIAMERRKLGLSELEFSRAGLGTMGFGATTEHSTAFVLMDNAIKAGVNWLDCAEIYPAPHHEHSFGLSERIVGEWLKAHGNRNELNLCTKIAGPAGWLPWVRGGQSMHSRNNLKQALSASLARLGTDYIDLLLLHWPDRASNFLPDRDYKRARQEPPFDIAQTVSVLAELVQSGQVRAVGLSNETAWGLGQFLRHAEHHPAARPSCVQQPYHLLNRRVDNGLGEYLHRDSVGLLAYAPLANGLLSGKYSQGFDDQTTRLGALAHYRRYATANARVAANRYIELARRDNLSGIELAFGWLASNPQVSSVIIGATSVAQLKQNLAALRTPLPPTVLKAINNLHQEFPNPCP